MRKCICFFALFLSLQSHAQNLKIAVFAPLYIDSAFNGNFYKLGINNLPKNILFGLDFYNGVMMAVDSLKANGKTIELLIYDTKGKETFSEIVAQPTFTNVGLMIASFNNRQEVKDLADIALEKQIPLISATFPNDGGVTNNPYFTVINTALKTQVEEIYKYTQRYLSTTNITYIYKRGSLESMLLNYFTAAAKSTPSIPLKNKLIELDNDFTPDLLTLYLDSTKQNTVIVGSLNEAFGVQVVKAISAAKAYSTTVVGMPTWDGVKEFDKQDCNGVTIVFTTSYNFLKSNTLLQNITNLYKKKFNSKPSDLFYKGYESVYHFGNILLNSDPNFLQNINDKRFKAFSDFDIQLNQNNYLENRKVHFAKKLDGVVK